MGRITNKYIEIKDEEWEGKTCPHLAPLTCLILLYSLDKINNDMIL